MERSISSAPLVARPNDEDFAHRIVDLKAKADIRGYSTLSYFLDIAMREAMIQADREAGDRKTEGTSRANL